MSESSPFQIWVVAAREAFKDDDQWLDGLECVASELAVQTDLQAGLQVRPRCREERDLTMRAAAAIARCRTVAPDVTTLLNGPEPLARDLGYDGVHWREAAIPNTPPAIPWFRTASVHDLESLHRAEAAGAALVLFAPVWASTWKRSTPVGLDGLRVIAAVARVPVFALGGVTPERVGACVSAGAAGVAVAGAVMHAEPAAALSRFKEVL